MPLGSGADVLAGFARRRLSFEPVSRILGHREFWGLPFRIDPAVLDPRPDTEGLVGFVVETLAASKAEALSVLDLGTGSGAILCAILTEFPRAQGVGLDRSDAACRTAKRNVAALGLSERARIVCGCWGDCLRGPFDVIVSNPPYIERRALDQLPRDVREFDPHAALDGGHDGLDHYKRIAAQLGRLLSRKGVAAVECGATQAGHVAALLEAGGLGRIVVPPGLGGPRPRGGRLRRRDGLTG